MKKITSSGFTLIELLVVIAIIAILATIVIISLSSAKSKSTDSRRLEDMHTIQNAISLYQANHGGDLPAATPDRGDGWAESYGNATTFMDNLVSDGDMPSVIVDPVNQSAYESYYYKVGSFGSCPSDTKAVLQFYMTTTAHPPFISCASQATSVGTNGWCICLQ